MATTVKFIPTRKSEMLIYGQQVKEVLTDPAADPTKLGLTAEDVTKLTALITAAQAAHDRVNAARMETKAATQALSAPGGAHDQLESHLRYIASTARVSNATDDEVMSIGVSRRDPSPTPILAPATAPEFTLVKIAPGTISVRFREEGSASPRARAENTKGVLIAVVDGVKPVVDGEADTVATLQCPRSPVMLDSTAMPAQVRLYACWVTDRGLTSPWSTPLDVTVA